MKLSKITWSPSSKKSFDDLVEFLELKWEKKVIVKLFSDLNFSLKLIAKNPELFPLVSEKIKLRKSSIKLRRISRSRYGWIIKHL